MPNPVRNFGKTPGKTAEAGTIPCYCGVWMTDFTSPICGKCVLIFS